MADFPYSWLPQRPQTRAECENGPRPCPWVACRYHMLVDKIPSLLSTNRKGRGTRGRPPLGTVIVADADEAAEVLATMPRTCSLDCVEPHGMTLDEVADVIGGTKEAARLCEESAWSKLVKGSKSCVR